MDLTSSNLSSLDASWRVDPPLSSGHSSARDLPRDLVWEAGPSYPTPASAPASAYPHTSHSRDADLPRAFPSSNKSGRRAVSTDDAVLHRVGPLPTAVWARVMDTSKGRDKVLKCVQYSLRTYLYLLGLIRALHPLSPWFKSHSKRLRLAVTSLSLARKCLLLLNPLHPLTLLLSPSPVSATTLIRHLIDLLSAVSDDVFCLSKLGLLDRRKGGWADKWANRFWFLTTIIGLWSLNIRAGTASQIHSPSPAEAAEGALAADPSVNEVVHPLTPPKQAVTRRLADARSLTQLKLLGDLAFVSYDVFHLSWFKEPVQCAMGLMTAMISSSILYDQHHMASLGK